MILTLTKDIAQKCPDQDLEVTLTVFITGFFLPFYTVPTCLVSVCTKIRLQNLVNHNIFAIVEAICSSNWKEILGRESVLPG